MRLFLAVVVILPEQQGNTPQASQADQRVNHTAEASSLSAENPGDQIKLENPNQAPVDDSPPL